MKRISIRPLAAVAILFGGLFAVAVILLWHEPAEHAATPPPHGISDGRSALEESTTHVRATDRPASASALPGIIPSSVIDDLDLTADFIDQLGRIVAPEGERFDDRHAAVQALSHNLAADEIQALYRFLLNSPPQGSGERVRDRVIKNDLLNRLRTQAAPAEGLTSVMVAMFDDPDQDQAVRDYALQQMRAWHDDAPAGERALILEAFSRGLKESESSIAGTALLALRELEAKATTAEDAESLAEASREAMTIAYSDSASDLSRITAMQVAAGVKGDAILPLAEEWALDPAAPYPRRLSAIAALGRSASPEAAAILAQVEASEDEFLKPALKNAFRQLRDAGVEASPFDNQ